MSAAGQKPGAGEPQAPAPDSSMEDILASIRRILAEDAAAPMLGAQEPGGAPPDDVLELTDAMLAPDQPATPAPPDMPPAAATAAARPLSEAEIDAMFSTPPTQPPVATPASPPPPTTEELIGGAAAAAAASSFAALRAARGQGAQPSQALPDIALGNGAVTLEQMVREELRPLLKAWLDANLPSLVERLVKAELERLARG